MLAIVVCGETAAAAAYSRAVANAAAVAHSPARVAAVVQVAHCSDLASATATAASAGASTVLVVGSAVGVRAVAAASRVESVLLEAALRDGKNAATTPRTSPYAGRDPNLFVQVFGMKV